MSGETQSRHGRVDPSFWRSRRVLVTGHTGFKGAWLCLWLQALGAEVHGASLEAMPSEPCLYRLARVGEGMASSAPCDIRDAGAVTLAVAEAEPEIVLHLAAQPLVRRSFAAPRETYETNAIGTLNVLEAVRACPSVEAVVVVTSDKCYENRSTAQPYREDDPLGGYDPYSSSKAVAELIASAYRRSFFAAATDPRVATARAGNVIGGGDWGEDRLVPDLIRGARLQKTTRLRHPEATRPWQHVLSPLSGYLVLAQALCGVLDPADGGAARTDRGAFAPDRYARAFNFGPDPAEARTVEWVVRRIASLWPGGLEWDVDEGPHPHEASLLALDSSLAHRELGWTPLVGLDAGLQATVAWYRAWHDGADMRELTLAQIRELG